MCDVIISNYSEGEVCYLIIIVVGDNMIISSVHEVLIYGSDQGDGKYF